MTWMAIFATAAACFALKLAGWSLPARFLERERLQRAAALLPLALLAALVVVQTFGDGRSIAVDARAAGLAAAGVAVLRRAPFIVVVGLAAATAALVRAAT
ncbi:MAG TPA: AzlD domain-containing protein [Gaiellaceae bacterium]|jgi:branched-subunit amino acid transport protein|nr:AzlD domain-containing protein [Gaiellaceae bacterium]